MCLRISKKFNTKREAVEFSKNPSIAKRDIIVYKGLDDYSDSVYFTPHQQFPFHKGFHYYQTGKKFTFEIISSNSGHDCSIYRGLHSCKNEKTAYDHGDTAFKMIIPKGSQYFENDEEYVSDNLIWY